MIIYNKNDVNKTPYITSTSVVKAFGPNQSRRRKRQRANQSSSKILTSENKKFLQLLGYKLKTNKR